MLCQCGSSITVRSIDGQTFTEIAHCEPCGREWTNTNRPTKDDNNITPPTSEIVKPRIPLGIRHPRPRQDTHNA